MLESNFHSNLIVVIKNGTLCMLVSSELRYKKKSFWFKEDDICLPLWLSCICIYWGLDMDWEFNIENLSLWNDFKAKAEYGYVESV